MDDTLTPAVIKRLYSAARRCPDYRCRLNKKNRSLDHIYPLSLGGAHSLLNIQVMCRSCNAKKHARPPLQLPLAGPSDGQRETRSERRRQDLKVLRETVYRLYDSGSMRREIAEVIGRTHSRVCQILNARKATGR